MDLGLAIMGLWLRSLGAQAQGQRDLGLGVAKWGLYIFNFEKLP